LETSTRLLRLLSLLQTRRDWSGADLSARLDVTTRTVRRDIDRLRMLGYPVDACPGAAVDIDSVRVRSCHHSYSMTTRRSPWPSGCAAPP